MTLPDLHILTSATLVVAGDVISVRARHPALRAIAALVADPLAPGVDPASILARIQVLSAAGPRGVAGTVNVAGGALHKSLQKPLHKSLPKALQNRPGGDGFGSLMLDWPTIEVPWREIGLLHGLKKTSRWDDLPVELPPQVEQRTHETLDLVTKQHDLRQPDMAWRRARIVVEAGNDLSAYMTPLGTNAAGPGTATALMFQTLLWIGSLIGLRYKARFNAPRPHELNPMLEPAIPVPTFSSYPSNHALQSFLIAELFARAVPEHPGIPALFQAAQTVAENREWAGLHVASDTKAGRELARMLMPVMDVVMAEHIARVRNEWYGGERA